MVDDDSWDQHGCGQSTEDQGKAVCCGAACGSMILGNAARPIAGNSSDLHAFHLPVDTSQGLFATENSDKPVCEFHCPHVDSDCGSGLGANGNSNGDFRDHGPLAVFEPLSAKRQSFISSNGISGDGYHQITLELIGRE